MADALVRAELPVCLSDGLSVGLAWLAAGPAPSPRRLPGKCLTGGVDDVKGEDVPEGTNVRITHQGEGTLRESKRYGMIDNR